MNVKGFVYQNKLYISIVLFLAIFMIVHISKPSLIYDRDGAFRPFGLGYSHKTVIPMWVAAIVLAILSYLAVSVYLQSDL
jgi:hypothetical protein